MAVRSAIINVMTRAAERAAKGLVRDFGEVENLQVSRKGPADFVSTADMQAERILREELHKARPEYSFLMEESGSSGNENAPARWIVDPLDGTTNFLHGLAHWCISIALEGDGEIVAAVLYDPIKDEMFWAEKGAGAFVNSRRLRVSARRGLSDALIATGIPFAGHGDAASFLPEIQRVMPQVAGIRRLGSAALDLAYVAAGRFDGYWETGLNPWDVAGGVLLVTEAGGFVTELDGERDPVFQGSVLAANPYLHPLLSDVLRPPATFKARTALKEGMASG